MVSFRVREVRVTTLDGPAFDAVLARAEAAGGASAFPILYSLRHDEPEVDPASLVDELARLAAAAAGTDETRLIGILRDDLLEGLTAADEG